MSKSPSIKYVNYSDFKYMYYIHYYTYKCIFRISPKVDTLTVNYAYMFCFQVIVMVYHCIFVLSNSNINHNDHRLLANPLYASTSLYK